MHDHQMFSTESVVSQNRLQPGMGIAIFGEENNPFIVPFSIGFQMDVKPVQNSL